jgi:hypothetical protein
VISTNFEMQTQTVQIVMNSYGLTLSPTNLANSVLYGFNATSQTFGVSAGGGNMSFTSSVNDGGSGWLSVNPTSGYISVSATNTLTNTYTTASLSPGDYTGRVTVVSTDAGGATGVVSIALHVLPTPILNTSPSNFRQVVDKGGNPTGEYFNVWNASAAPVGSMAYRVFVTNDGSSIVQGVSPSDGISTGQHDTIGIFFRNVSGFEGGIYTAVVAVAGPATKGTGAGRAILKLSW